MNLRQRFIAPLLVISLTSSVSSGWAADQPSPVLKGPPKAVASTGNFWGELEFLYWQTKGDKLPALVTSGGTGAIAAAGTSVLFGNSTVNEDWRPGGRTKAGYWFDSSHTSGVEAHFFGLADTSTRFNAASGGTPLLARPFFNTVINAQDALLIAAPGIVSGQVSASETSRLFGLGADYRKQLCSSCFLGSVSGLIGYRYLKLSDDLQISSVQNAVFIPATFAVIDQFNTRNHFNGVNLGLTGVAPYGAWRFEWLAKVALGATNTDLTINGATTTTVGGVSATAAGGLLALSSNIGRHSDSRFSTVSEFSTRVAYQVSPQWKGYVGYDVMYWTGVVRPGGAIDTVVNSNLLPPGAPGGPARPAVQFSSTDFWSQGVSIGLAYNY
jgi:hypothetical protein